MAKRKATCGSGAEVWGKRPATMLPEDFLDCPICSDRMAGRIYQCSAGHWLCEDCLDRLIPDAADAKCCPTCRARFPASGIIRNLALESLAESCRSLCRTGFSEEAEEQAEVDREPSSAAEPAPCTPLHRTFRGSWLTRAPAPPGRRTSTSSDLRAGSPSPSSPHPPFSPVPFRGLSRSPSPARSARGLKDFGPEGEAWGAGILRGARASAHLEALAVLARSSEGSMPLASAEEGPAPCTPVSAPCTPPSASSPGMPWLTWAPRRGRDRRLSAGSLEGGTNSPVGFRGRRLSFAGFSPETPPPRSAAVAATQASSPKRRRCAKGGGLGVSSAAKAARI